MTERPSRPASEPPDEAADDSAPEQTGPAPGAEPPRTIHDSFFKQAFGSPAIAADELRLVLPAGAAACIDWDTMTPAPPNFVKRVLRQRLGDLVFHAELVDEGEALLWFLLEHQSTESRWMAQRVAEMETTMWQHWRALYPKLDRLPAIVPVVVYHGARPWSAPTAMEGLYALSQPAQTALGEHLLRCRFVLDDLSVVTDEELRARRMDVYGRLALLAMARGLAEDFFDRLAAGWLEELRMLAHGSEERFESFFVYTLHVNPHTEEDAVERLIAAVADDKTKDGIMTAAQRLMKKGYDQGRREREQEEVARWRGLAQSLLQERFGPLPAPVAALIAAASSDELERWTGRILKSKTLDEVFATPPPANS